MDEIESSSEAEEGWCFAASSFRVCEFSESGLKLDMYLYIVYSVFGQKYFGQKYFRNATAACSCIRVEIGRMDDSLHCW